MAGCKYLFSYPKYNIRHISEIWPVIDIYFLIPNIKLLYIWKVYVFETWTVGNISFSIQNMRFDIYLKPGLLQMLVFEPKIL